MKHALRPSRRSFALLLVLAALVLTTTSLVALARSAAATTLRRTLDRAEAIADELRPATEDAILHWLETESDSIVLPPEAEFPAVAILHDRFVLGQYDCSIQLTAWDECGRVSMHLARTASPLRGAIPSAVLDVLDEVDLPDDGPLGLDLLALDNARPIYPPAIESVPIVFESPERGLLRDFNQIQPDNSVLPPAGAYLASHQPTPGLINVNTASVALLQSALRMAGRGGLERIIAARSLGEPVALAALTGTEQQSAGRYTPRLVSSSVAWGVRIDLRVGPLRRSWWEIYERSSTSWECVQRRVITQ